MSSETPQLGGALEIWLEDEQATISLGQRLAEQFKDGGVIYLEGSLGAGKTTLTRGVLRHFGHSGAVKSPTYTLVEPYGLNDITINHFDLYRLGEAEELEFMGIRDYFDNGTLCLIEWPDRGRGYLPGADIHVRLAPASNGRKATLLGETQRGLSALSDLSAE